MATSDIERAYLDELPPDNNAPVGISPSLAKALLKLNPQLREQGHTTASLVAGSQAAASGQKGNEVIRPGQSLTQRQGAKMSSTEGAFEHMEHIKKRIELAEQLAQKRAADAQAALHATLSDELSQLERWLLKHDADLRSPITQEAIDRYQPLLLKLGFSVKGYATRHRQKAKA